METREFQVCGYCESLFVARSKTHKYCTKSCRGRVVSSAAYWRWKETRPPAQPVYITKACEACEASFVYWMHPGRKPKYCQECASKRDSRAAARGRACDRVQS